jgi:multiple sugar transport system permease protein
VLLSKNLLRTATVGIALYPGEYAFPWELITTATFLAILPLLLFTFVFQRKIVSGLTSGAVK